MKALKCHVKSIYLPRLEIVNPSLGMTTCYEGLTICHLCTIWIDIFLVGQTTTKDSLGQTRVS